LNTSYQRVLKFKGFSNFRDLGGYAATDGAQVKWGVLYRSGNLAKAKSADLKRLESLDIHTVIDFRSDLEREKTPNRLPDPNNIKTLSIPILEPSNSSWAKELRVAIQTKNIRNFDSSAKMGEWYQYLAVENVDQYKCFIHAVFKAQGAPVLWHCTAGKDRTGLAAAILLRLLGVQQDVVVKDYLLSANYADQRRSLILLLRLTRGKAVADTIQTFMIVQKEWIEAAFRAIELHWGSFETYSQEALELSGEQINQFRHNLLDGEVHTNLPTVDR
jgi:protein-tyrosine phosphatase